MYNIKKINKNNLLFNLDFIKNKFPSICAMVKADAYGHGIKNIIKCLNGKVDFYGVANIKEALQVKKITKKNVLIVGKCNDYYCAIKNGISITIDSIIELKKIKRISTLLKMPAKIHIAVNTGMNRIGVKNLRIFNQIINFINNNQIIMLEGLFTHFYDADLDNNHFSQQMLKFEQYVNKVKYLNVIIHIGGSYVLKHKMPSFVNMVRVGYFLYGYGDKNLKPIMSIESKIIKIINCEQGENIGYGNNQISSNKKIAVIPIGYGDGLCRRLSNRYKCIVNNKKVKIIGNVCMDSCMIDITNVKCKVGDKVNILNVQLISRIVKTSPYEILTNFQSFRGKCLIVY